jgi:nucleoside-diphosphate-sugar epimerase
MRARVTAAAFDQAVVSDPPFEAVVHTASPFHFNVTDNKRDILDPAINGTVGILRAIKRSAPTVKRVVITSSFAAIVNPSQTERYTYSEKDWNPVTMEEALADTAGYGYRGSKTFAEKAAWEFVEKEKPNFTLATCNPPLVLGPIVHYLNSLDAINTSNQRFWNLVNGNSKEKLGPTGVYLWIDVRDLALAHALCMEKSEAGGKRFFLVAGHFSNRELAEIAYKNYPELRDKLPSGDTLKEGDYPEGGTIFQYDNTVSKEVLGIKYGSLEQCAIDTFNSILEKRKSQ